MMTSVYSFFQTLWSARSKARSRLSFRQRHGLVAETRSSASRTSSWVRSAWCWPFYSSPSTSSVRVSWVTRGTWCGRTITKQQDNRVSRRGTTDLLARGCKRAVGVRCAEEIPSSARCCYHCILIHKFIAEASDKFLYRRTRMNLKTHVLTHVAGLFASVVQSLSFVVVKMVAQDDQVRSSGMSYCRSI